MSDKIKILWVDDEIDFLKPHIMFLEAKGYEVHTTNNGSEALDLIKVTPYDIIFLDENMPGLSGLETLPEIKKINAGVPVIMITKSEEESIMDDAIGSKISDYLIKPVNPKQIILALKKHLDKKTLESEKATMSYQQEFRKIGMDLSGNLNFEEWITIYKKLVFWELELQKSQDSGVGEILAMQKSEANSAFAKFVERNYVDWVNGKSASKPLQSHTLLKEKLFPLLDQNESCFLFLIDNLRYDQWKAIQPIIEEYYRVEKDEIYYSILPTATQYARNALFSGLMPSEIAKRYPQYWVEEDEEGTKNQFESELMGEYLKRYGKNIKYSYNKILNLNAGRKLVDTLPNLLGNKLNIIVYNFVDMLSHSRTDMEVIKELADDEKAYRSLTVSWFEHSPLFEMIKYLAQKNVKLIITTDHGSMKVDKPVKVLGDKKTNTNLRYKFGRALDYNRRDVFEVKNPQDIFLPRINISTSYIFCRESDFFAYPNNYNYYVNMYSKTFQHGGISLEEMLIPCITLSPK